MVEVTMQQITQLREKTNAGIMDCKKALQDASGDMEQAVDILRKKGIARAAKRQDREAKEGVVKVTVSKDGTTAYLSMLTSETDFVSRNDKFQKLAADIHAALEKETAADMEAFQARKLGTKTIKDTVDEFGGVIGEKITLNKIEVMTASAGEFLGTYLHMNDKIGVALLVENGQVAENTVKDIAMHIAAASPVSVDVKDIPTDMVERERSILKEQVMNEGKPEAIAEKIVEGKLRKFYEETCLLEQNFVKDPDKKIKDVLIAAGKTAGQTLTVKKFIRFMIG